MIIKVENTQTEKAPKTTLREEFKEMKNILGAELKVTR